MGARMGLGTFMLFLPVGTQRKLMPETMAG